MKASKFNAEALSRGDAEREGYKPLTTLYHPSYKTSASLRLSASALIIKTSQTIGIFSLVFSYLQEECAEKIFITQKVYYPAAEGDPAYPVIS